MIVFVVALRRLWRGERALLYNADCIQGLRQLAENSIDSIVTDPPYELGFMGKSWDSTGIAYSVELWREALRVLKPGGHLLAFGGSRTFHRLAVAIEDAGFEIRDTLMWLYGSGFPKSLDVSKAIDKVAGAERTEGARVWKGGNREGGAFGGGSPKAGGGTTELVKYDTPATEAAKQWEGWGTALKPAFEPIIMARKPLSGTVAQNVLQWGVGGLNIDGCRIPFKGDSDKYEVRVATLPESNSISGGKRVYSCEVAPNDGGRWPANVILDEVAATMLDEQSGTLTSGKTVVGSGGSVQQSAVYGRWKDGRHVASCYADSGGASRFFYVAKAPQSERWFYCNTCKVSALVNERSEHEGHELIQHPTQKPENLIAYLQRLVTPAGGVTCDPFTGSGTAMKTAKQEGFSFVGFELNPDYCKIAEARAAIVKVGPQLSLFAV